MEEALTHRSAGLAMDNERLEFHGDAVLRLLAAGFLRQHWPELPVGELSRVHNQLVSNRELARLGQAMDLQPLIHMGVHARHDSTATTAILARSCEALLGGLHEALRLGGGDGLRELYPWLESRWLPLVQELLSQPQLHHWKTALQEWSQATHACLPTYVTEEVEAAHGHPRRFAARVHVAGELLGQGRGPSRRQAEQAAAAQAWAALHRQPASPG
ncbi:ribonuclease III family protein [Candidatus Synechococcus spongiarum]|uniref:ribonuclease III family protein n=1 Tax=Candidatus Synechococcus spongiarum TaxID=431041 RepID=UPI001177FFEE|nr:ribonuclease III domain-containing protein [Candidatus Synechococcus spongiarum]